MENRNSYLMYYINSFGLRVIKSCQSPGKDQTKIANTHFELGRKYSTQLLPINSLFWDSFSTLLPSSPEYIPIIQMQPSPPSSLSTRSKNILFNLKTALAHYKVDLKTLIVKLFGQFKPSLKSTQFEKIIRFGDLKITYDEIDNVFEEMQQNDVVDVGKLQQELDSTQSPYSALTNLEKQGDIKDTMLVCLKEVKSTMVKEDPHYIFDLYDVSKDGCLDIGEFNNMLMGCCASERMDVEMRKQILRVLLKNCKYNKMTKKQFFQLFGLENIPKRVSLPQPAPNLLKKEDKDLAQGYIMKSRLATKDDIKQFQNRMQNQVLPYPPLDPKKHMQESPNRPQQPIKIPPPQPQPTPPQFIPQFQGPTPTPKPKQPSPPKQLTKKAIVQPQPQSQPLPTYAQPRANTPNISKPTPPPPPPPSVRPGRKYYRLQQATKHVDMIDLLSFYLERGEVFFDDEAPGTTKGEYLHAKDIFKTPKFSLFQVAASVISREKDRSGLAQWLQPKDIIQGSLGDCYFLSSISSLVQYYPECLSQLFLFDINPSGMYVVRLFNDGQWASIVLDDRFPCVYGKPIFAKPHGNQIWVLLLEKAWAKIHGSYQSIDMGSSMEALIALTGAPCKFYRKQDENIENIIKTGFSNGSVVTCSGSDELNELSKEQTQVIGLISRHAYSVQKLIQVNSNGRKQLLIKIRNPWGDEEWKGDWSFKSPKWTEQLRKQYNYVKNPQDGSFYMPWEQFEKYFGSITVCRIVPNSHSSCFRSNNRRHKSNYLRMSIRKKGEYTISIYQESKRKYQNTLNYELSESRLIILKVDNSGNFEYIESSTKQSSNLHLQCVLSEGEYILSCKVIWKHFEQHECVVSSYGPSEVSFKAHTDRSITSKFKSQMIKSFSNKVSGDKNYYTKLNIPDAYREVVFNVERGLGYIRVNNPSNKAFSTTIALNKSKGIKIIKPEVLPIKLSAMPQTDNVTGFFLSAKGYSYSLEEKMKTIV